MFKIYPFEILNANCNSLHKKLHEEQNKNIYELGSSQPKLGEAERPLSSPSLNAKLENIK
jgi:hypothetical protein